MSKLFTTSFLFWVFISTASAASLEEEFANPPEEARPGVFWSIMDGNLSREGITADLESMKEAGLGSFLFFEVNVGVPRGPVDFMSEPWQELFVHAVHESERLGLDLIMFSGPGWTGSGGPWIEPEQAMQHLLFSVTEATGPTKFDAVLPVPKQRPTPWATMKSDFHEDVAVYAFPRCKPVIADINEKALYRRNPYTSMPGVRPYLPTPARFTEPDRKDVISPKDIIDLTKHLDSDGRLRWDVPAGEWTIVRMVRRATCACSRPAPKPGLGLECNKFDAAALDIHFENFLGKLLKKAGPRKGKHGWTTINMDSWEVGAQNWTKDFLDQFQKRRGYDAKPYLLAYTGRAVEGLEKSERFLWDVRRTAQELVLENYAKHMKQLGQEHGLDLSIEPYDMTPLADLDLGAVADIPMCEFWSDGFGFDSSFSCIEATSVAHTMGRPVVAAEAFTASKAEKWKQYPWSMKDQGDWAFCMGINRFLYVVFSHKPLGDAYRPGMTMGPYGVHWDRGQTWWPMAGAYHKYVSRCSHLMRQGTTVSDILYLTPEGAPHVFRPPASALDGTGPLADKKGYGFDGCSPNILMDRAEVRDGRIAFPGGTSYRLMVLPQVETMTPELLAKIDSLIQAGATVVAGAPPVKSPSLVNYPQCDATVRKLAEKIWGGLDVPQKIAKRKYGQGTIYYGKDLYKKPEELYPHYDDTAALLKRMGVDEDFSSTSPIRYGHRRTDREEIYFVSNKTSEPVAAECTFRVANGKPQLWNPVTGQRRLLPQYKTQNGRTTIPLEFNPRESFFIVFASEDSPTPPSKAAVVNFPKTTQVAELQGPWQVNFDPKWGGPETTTFDALIDWTKSDQRGIKYYSGIATYRKTFDLPASIKTDSNKKIYLDLGTVHDMARVRLNGHDLGVVWCAPWRVDISSAVQPGKNRLEIEIANRWANRMIGDQEAPDANARTVQWKEGFLGGKEYKTGRHTFSTHKTPDKLLPSGLLGPMRILKTKE